MAQQKVIPAKLHEELLCRLPSNNLLNLKCVCKRWNELISSQSFIQKHTDRRSKTGGCSETLIVTLSPSKIKVTGKESRWSVSYPPGFSVNNTRIAGSCDGFVCLLQMTSKVFAVINPSTGQSEVLIIDGFDFRWLQFYWFGKHPSTGEYSIIAIAAESFIQVYQFSSKLTSLHQFPIASTLCQCNEIPILLHGALHWPVILYEERLVVLAYDFQKNQLLQIMTPFTPSLNFKLGMVDGCLFAIIRTWHDMKFELWIMKEYGVEDSWTKYGNIEGFEERWALSPVGSLPNGDLILKYGNKKIVKYNFGNKKGTFLHVYRDDDSEKNIVIKSAVLCADSLVSPASLWEN